MPGRSNAGKGPTSAPATSPDFAVASRGSGLAHEERGCRSPWVTALGRKSGFAGPEGAA